MITVLLWLGVILCVIALVVIGIRVALVFGLLWSLFRAEPYEVIDDNERR